MDIGIPQNLLLVGLGAFLFGWILAAANARFGGKASSQRDPKDQRILSLEADLRVARTDLGQAREKLEAAEKRIDEISDGIENRDKVIQHQQASVEKLKKDLKDSVCKTRELRNELSERATQSVRSEAKLREVETELSVAQASTDLLATGVLDYSVAPDAEDSEEAHGTAGSSDFNKFLT